MLKKVWFMLVLCSVLMVSGCSGGMSKDNMDSVAVSDDVVSDLIMAEAEQVETTVTEEQSEDSSNVETSNTEEPYFYIECAGVYQGNSVEFYEFRCYR